MTEESKAKHTEGNLVIGAPGEYGITLYADNVRLKDDPHYPAMVANCYDPTNQFTNAESHANAARLVKCWNCHDELVEACKSALSCCAFAVGSMKTKDLLKAALAKAEGSE